MEFPHIILIALYRTGLGAKLIADKCGLGRRSTQTILNVLKGCGVFEAGRRHYRTESIAATAKRRALKAEEKKAARAAMARPSPAELALRTREYHRKRYYLDVGESRRRSALSAAKRWNRIKHDPDFKVLRSVRATVSRIARIYKGRKSLRSIRYLGCTAAQARAHIEAQFKPGMTWGNHGEWHIDHIIPLAAFDMTQPAQMMQATNYKNLQPLWAIENLTKSARFESVQLELIAA
jgi:hypothetical protein